MKTTLPILLLLLCLAPGLSGGEYRIQIHRPAKVGLQYQLSCQAELTQKTTVSTGPTVLQTQRTNRTMEAEAQVKVLETDAQGRITQAAMTLTSLIRVEGRDRTEMLPAGTTVLASFVNEREQFSVKGKAVDTETQIALSLILALQKQQGIESEAFGTNVPKKIGDTWDIDVALLVAAFEKLNVAFSKDDIQGQTTLEGLTKVGEVECLELASKVYIKNLSSPPLPGLKVKRFFGSIRWSGRLPVDTSLGLLEESVDFSMDFTAEGKPNPNGPAMTLVSSTAVKRTAKMSYAK